jgi:hypothetical protein
MMKTMTCRELGGTASSATLLLLTQPLVCCIHRLNPRPFAAESPGSVTRIV